MTQHIGRGGAEREVVAFANALSKLGEEIHIACVKEVSDDYFPDSGIVRHQLTRSSGVRIPKLRRLCNNLHPAIQLRELKADVIIIVNVPVDYAKEVRLATWCSRTRFIYALRNNPEKKYPDEREREKWQKLCTLADGIWIQTEKQRSFFSPDQQEKIFIVPNLLERRFLEIQRKERTQIRRFISVGRIYPQKNQKLLVSAFARMLIRTGNIDATLTIYGSPPLENSGLEQELKKLIREFQLETRIFLPGRASDIEQKYEEADAFVFSSDYEGCPNALMEAMAAGLPCISTDCPTGPSDLITNGTDGLLIPVGDVEEMSRAMQFLLENPQAANQMGRAAKRRMREWGSQEKIAEQMQQQLKRLCTGTRIIKPI